MPTAADASVRVTSHWVLLLSCLIVHKVHKSDTYKIIKVNKKLVTTNITNNGINYITCKKRLSTLSF